MITFLLSGHGHFASGIGSAIELIAGAQEAFEAIDFDGAISQEELMEKYKSAIEKFGNKEVIICTDLVSGTPFKAASTLKMMTSDKNIEVITGTNLGLLLEGLMSRAFIEEAGMLANGIVSTGKDQVVRFELVKREEVESDDGI